MGGPCGAPAGRYSEGLGDVKLMKEGHIRGFTKPRKSRLASEMQNPWRFGAVGAGKSVNL